MYEDDGDISTGFLSLPNTYIFCIPKTRKVHDLYTNRLRFACVTLALTTLEKDDLTSRPGHGLPTET
jgi:hypothetical protein